MTDFVGVVEFPAGRTIPVKRGLLILPDLDVPAGEWSPFDADGHVRNLAAEGWRQVGVMVE